MYYRFPMIRLGWRASQHRRPIHFWRQAHPNNLAWPICGEETPEHAVYLDEMATPVDRCKDCEDKLITLKDSEAIDAIRAGTR